MKNNITTLKNYQYVCDSLSWLINTSMAAEIHGAICAHICIGKAENPKLWMKRYLKSVYNQCVEEFSDEDFEQGVEFCLKLYQETQKEINSNDFSFSLLLPNDEESIIYRVKSLTYWSIGFYENFNISKELLSVFSEESQLSIDYIKKSQDLVVDFDTSGVTIEETYYVEIMEYIRLSVIMIYIDSRSVLLKSSNKDTFH